MKDSILEFIYLLEGPHIHKTERSVYLIEIKNFWVYDNVCYDCEYVIKKYVEDVFKSLPDYGYIKFTIKVTESRDFQIINSKLFEFKSQKEYEDFCEKGSSPHDNLVL